MSYIAERSIKVQKADGTYDLRRPGDAVPEAEKWPNVALWVKRKYLRLADGLTTAPGLRTEYKPPRAVTQQDLAQREKNLVLRQAGIQSTRTDFEPAGPTNIGPGKDQPSAALDFTSDAEPGTEEDVFTKLCAMTRKELVAMADKLGVEVAQNATKEQIAKGIMAK